MEPACLVTGYMGGGYAVSTERSATRPSRPAVWRGSPDLLCTLTTGPASAGVVSSPPGSSARVHTSVPPDGRSQRLKPDAASLPQGPVCRRRGWAAPASWSLNLAPVFLAPEA